MTRVSLSPQFPQRVCTESEIFVLKGEEERTGQNYLNEEHKNTPHAPIFSILLPNEIECRSTAEIAFFK